MPAATPEALDALIAASQESRREGLLRTARRQRIGTRVAFSCSGCPSCIGRILPSS
jgi:hypothetical protein